MGNRNEVLRRAARVPSIPLAVLVTLTLAIVIALAGLTPGQGASLGSDKLDHAIAFAALVIPLAMCRPRWVPWIIVGACAYGAAIEIVQPAVGRTADIGDFGADAVGSMAGCVIGVCLAWIARRLAG